MLYTEINLPKHTVFANSAVCLSVIFVLLGSLHHCNMLTEFKTKMLT